MRKLPLAVPVRVTIDGLDSEGNGVGWAADVDGTARRASVAGTLPGEIVTASVAHRSPHTPTLWADLVTIETPATTRVAPPCPAFGRCGGCPLGHLDVAAQRSWKETHLATMVAASGSSGTARVHPLTPSPRSRHYRNQSKLVIARDATNGTLRLGGYARRSHEVVDLRDCQLVEAPLADAGRVLGDVLASSPIAIYDERARTGELRYALLRANAAGAVMLTLVTRSEGVNHLDELVKQLVERFPFAGVVQSINPSAGNTLYGERHRVLRGRDHFDETIAGRSLSVSFRSFFQINRGVAEAMWLTARALAAEQPVAKLIDVYCGVGGFGLALATPSTRLVGIEVVEPAVVDARQNAERAGIAAEFFAGDAAERLTTVGDADLVLLNPPRRGCDEVVLAAAAARRPARIFYMSCAADTLLRDADRLHALGYDATAFFPFDMMPHTPHYEVLATFVRR